jgi:hypothetical protein
MFKIRFALRVLTLVTFACAFAVVAQAQATRTWVSGVGDDVNPCSRTAPCKTFAGAISKTAEGGEIDALDPAGYGTLTITKSITVDGGFGSGWASVLVSAGTSGFIVNVTTNPTTSVVTLRNISVNGVKNCVTAGCQGGNGVRFIAGKTLHMRNMTIFGLTTNGLDVNTPTANPIVTVEDSEFSNIGASGISITSTGTIGARIRNVTIKGCGTGVSSAANSRVTIDESTISNNTTGIATASGSETNVTETLISNHTTGINVVSGATVRIGNNTIAQNSTGVANPAGSVVQSTGDSRFMGNPTDRSGAAFSPLVKQ